MMQLYIDTATKNLVTSPQYKTNVETFSFMRGDSAPIAISFVSGFSSLSAVATNKLITFGIKAQGIYGDGPYLVTTNTFTVSGNNYNIAPSFNTAGLNSLLNAVDGISGNDVASVAANLQITWSDNNGTDWNSTPVIPITIYNDLISGNEGTPVTLPTPEDWLDNLRPLPLILSTAPISEGRQQMIELTITGATEIPDTAIPFTFGGALGYTSGNINVPLVSNETEVAVIVVDTLNADVAFNPYYAASSSGGTITIQAFGYAANDPSLSLFIDTVGGIVGGTSTTTVEGLDNGTPGSLGQDAIVAESAVYKCVSVDPKYKWTQLG